MTMNMKKLILWLILAIGVIVGLDVACGVLFNGYLKNHTMPGDYEMTDHVVRHFDEDVLVLGSSVALNSINTKTIEDSLGMKAFNGAANGQSFPFYLTMLKAVMQQKKPKHIILGLTSNNLTDSGKGVRYNFLSPYYGCGIADVDSVLNGSEKSERIFLNSTFYRLNRIWFRIFLYHFVSAGIKGENGFIAKPMPPMFPDRLVQEETKPISDERYCQVEEFVSICHDNGIDLMVVFTPQCVVPADVKSPVVKSLRGILDRRGYKLYDDSSLKPFDVDNTLFYDGRHINVEGSKIYTDTIISRMK